MGTQKVVRIPKSGMNPFVENDVTKIPLGWDDHFIVVRNVLGVGATKQMQSAGIKYVGQDEVSGEPKVGLDMPKMGVARANAYIVDWSFRDKNQVPIAVTPEAINALRPDVFDLISAKLDEHVEAMTADTKAEPGATEQTSN